MSDKVHVIAVLKSVTNGDTIQIEKEKHDTERTDNLRQTPEADAQGENRFQRGQHFYYQGASEAARLGADFKWELITVPGVGHNGSKMAKAAVKIIEERLLN